MLKGVTDFGLIQNIGPGPDSIRLVFLASARVADGSIIVYCGESYIGRIRCPGLGE